jgi:26S proteasome regulatory subunit T5
VHVGKMAQLEDQDIFDDGEDALDEEVLRMSIDEITSRTRLLENDIKIMKSETSRISHEQQGMKEKIKENSEKIKVFKVLPYLVSNVVELLDITPGDQEEEEGGHMDLDAQRKGKAAVIKTSTRQVSYLPLLSPHPHPTTLSVFLALSSPSSLFFFFTPHFFLSSLFLSILAPIVARLTV